MPSSPRSSGVPPRPARAAWRELIQQRSVWLAGLLLLTGLQAVRLTYEARFDTQTVDEGIHLASGYTFLRTGEYRLDKEHPPLARLLCALPLRAMGVDPRLDAESWRVGDMVAQGTAIIFGQKAIPAERVMLAARSGTILLTLVLSLALACWVRGRFGAGAGWLAAVLITLEPNLNAHGHLVTTDLAAALTCFLACIAFDRMLRTGTRASVVLAGLALGSALAAKFSMLFLLPVLVILMVAARIPPRRAAGQFVWVLTTAAIVVVMSYGDESRRAAEAPPLVDQVAEGGMLNNTLRFAGTSLGVPAHPYLVGLGLLGAHQETGHEAFLLGEVYKGGKWQYFPVAFLVKTPLGALMMVLLSIPLLRRAPARDWLLLGVPVVLYAALTITGGINIGLRHLLPVYPLLYALSAGLLGRYGSGLYGRSGLILATGACCLLGYESARIAPRDLAFFNAAAGGPARGPDYLVDSNIDWGQSLGELVGWLGNRKPADVCLAYFGTAPAVRYGFPLCALPPTQEVRKGERVERPLAAISVTLLQGVYHKREWYGWLRERTPIARVGWSIYVYDVGDLLRADRR